MSRVIYKTLLTTIIFLCFSIAANTKVFVCDRENYMKTNKRKYDRFIEEAHINFVMPQYCHKHPRRHKDLSFLTKKSH